MKFAAESEGTPPCKPLKTALAIVLASVCCCVVLGSNIRQWDFVDGRQPSFGNGTLSIIGAAKIG